jgi:hypothetical protein
VREVVHAAMVCRETKEGRLETFGVRDEFPLGHHKLPYWAIGGAGPRIRELDHKYRISNLISRILMDYLAFPVPISHFGLHISDFSTDHLAFSVFYIASWLSYLVYIIYDCQHPESGPTGSPFWVGGKTVSSNYIF